MGIIWTNYFDDFPTFDTQATAASADTTVRSMFKLLGWSFAIEERKNKPFAKTFSFLGVVANLSKLHEGKVIFSNKADRIVEIVDTLRKIIDRGTCSQPEMASLRGRCAFAAAQVFGRLALGPLSSMSSHQYSKRGPKLDDSTMADLRFMEVILTSFPSRTLDCTGSQDPILVFTDGASEEAGTTVGAVIVDTASPRRAWMFGGHVPPELLAVWTAAGSKQVIGQAEIFPVLLARKFLQGKCKHRRILIFVDNDSARQALSKGRSPVPASNAMIQYILSLEMKEPALVWYSRVPTHSNPADAPSRLILIPSADNCFAQVVEMPSVTNELL